MEKKETPTKKIPVKLAVVIGIALVAVVAVIFLLIPKDESYRQVQVYKVDGTADVERQPVGILEAYDNMMLQTEDIVNVSEDSNMQVKLDEDKYILLEPKTRIHLEATGTSEDSKTKIYLEEGAIVCNIENPLSENSTYEVNTPNSTMAVRGTTFRVALDYDETGDSYAVVAVFEGKVVSHLVYPDGSVAEEGVSIEKGLQAQIKGTDDDSMYIVTDQEISYEEFERVTLEFLNVLIKKGEELSITEDVIESFIEKIESEEIIISTEEQETEDTEKENIDAEENRQEVTSETGETTTEETETEEDASSDNSGTTGDGSSSSTETKQYTVTFVYNGETFATQKVTSGKCATEPLLMPTAAGYWDFDFTKKITANATVEWVDNSSLAE